MAYESYHMSSFDATKGDDMMRLITTSNTKLGGKIAQLNMPQGVTCEVDVPCRENGCYCLKGNMVFPNVRNSHMQKYQAYIANPVAFFQEISSELDWEPFKYFRWHSSGDIVDEQYLDLMCKLARKHKTIHFLCFTKKYKLVNNYLNTHKKPSNLVICLSNWGTWRVENPHNLPESFVDFGNGDENIPEFAYECPGHCDQCPGTHCFHMRKGDSVMFHKH